MIPIVAIVGGYLVTGAFADRYAITAVIGFAITFSMIAQRLSGGRFAVVLAIILCLLGGFLFQAVYDYNKFGKQRSEINDTVTLLESPKADATMPIVIASPDLFFELSYYVSPQLVSRLIYLGDKDASFKYVGTDHVDRGLMELAQLSPLKVAPYHLFIDQQDEFLLLQSDADWAWTLRALIEANAELQFVAQEKDQVLMRVSKSKRDRVPGS